MNAALQRRLDLHQQGRLAEAEQIYRDILRQEPDHFDALHLLGVIALQSGRADQAAELIGRAIALNDEVFAAHSNRAVALQTLHRHAEALAHSDQAVALMPESADAHYNRGISLQALQRDDAALASFDRAIALRPDHAAAHRGRGAVLRALDRPEEALASYDRAIALHPDHVASHVNRAVLLRELGRREAALASCATAVSLDPQSAVAHFNHGVALRDLAQHAAALVSYEQAIRLDPQHVEAHYNRGIALQGLDRHADAVASYDRAIALRPDDVAAHCNASLCLLKLGELRRGWAEYEWRWQAPEFAAGRRELRQRLWLGEEELAGKTILLHAEQGFGDTLQFCRYVRLVAARGGTVILEVPAPMVRLMASLGADTVVAAGDRLPPFDLHCPLMSLPLAFGTTVETVPADVPYLAADPEQVAVWQRRLEALPGRRVGLVWAGSTRRDSPEAMAIDRRRSLALVQLAALAAVPDASFVSLQKGEPALDTLSPPPGMALHDHSAELSDFADTAALVAALDLVISVDTAVAHLAGALGRPVWILNRFDACWRWLTQRTDSPWYPTARLFRQPTSGDWSSVIAEVAAALSAGR